MTTESASAVLPSFPLPPPFYKLYAPPLDDDGGEGRSLLPPDPPPPPNEGFLLFAFPFDPVCVPRCSDFAPCHLPSILIMQNEDPVPQLQGKRLYEQRPDGTVGGANHPLDVEGGRTRAAGPRLPSVALPPA